MIVADLAFLVEGREDLARFAVEDAEANAIALELGLLPFAEFAARPHLASRRECGQGYWLADYLSGRNTGRTTRVLMHALAALRRPARKAQRVVFTADDLRFAKMQTVALAQYAKRLGLDPKRVVEPTSRGDYPSDVVVFVDPRG